MGFLALIAKSCGAGDTDAAKKAAAQTTLVVLAAGIFATVVCTAVSGMVPVWMQVDPAIQKLAGTYFLILYLPMLFRSASILFGTVLRAAGDTRTPMKVGIIVNCMNVVLNFLLIYDTRTLSLLGFRFTMPGAGWGVIGAAAASALSYVWGGIHIMKGRKRVRGDESLRVSLYLDNAMYGNLHVFVIDFDSFYENSGFFTRAKELADKVTRSQGGGYHMFYGIDKNTATPLFDSINLLASGNAKSFVSSTGNITLDGANKVDFFCDARHFIYEWEPWDNAAGLTDRTQGLYELIRDNFALKRPMDVGQHRTRHRAASGAALRDELDELDLLPRMNAAQKEIFECLKDISPDCTPEKWFSIGLDIWHVFGDDLGGDVFTYWSEPGESFNPQGCAVTWGNVMECGPDRHLNNRQWDAILHENVKSAF